MRSHDASAASLVLGRGVFSTPVRATGCEPSHRILLTKQNTVIAGEVRDAPSRCEIQGRGGNSTPRPSYGRKDLGLSCYLMTSLRCRRETRTREHSHKRCDGAAQAHGEQHDATRSIVAGRRRCRFRAFVDHGGMERHASRAGVGPAVGLPAQVCGAYDTHVERPRSFAQSLGQRPLPLLRHTGERTSPRTEIRGRYPASKAAKPSCEMTT